ncbi:MAG: UDP-N-acetylmuramoyl-L-alanyl-D-glutamate--2,6-diaminopimelate ligase [Alphaproteobacteria bacterium]|nr:UDP-N-acetylmuramoyl-L-alanyl-D-glutamate--2,6-diaminopimelate ligase [Alphaproteobacteria bacterium]
MKLKTLLKKAGIPHTLSRDIEVAGLADDSRDVRAGYAFVARGGTKTDGAQFVPDAVASGAVVILAEKQIKTSVPVVAVADLVGKLPALARAFYPSAGVEKVAVTGTNGKTSVAFYVQQIMNRLGVLSASIGTLGVDAPVLKRAGNNTTPGVIELHRTLAELQRAKVRVAVMEASSHGLHQGRLDGLRFAAGAFTNLTRDHMDYHQTMEHYYASKLRLFTDYVAADGVAVLNADAPEFDRMKKACARRGQAVYAYGFAGAELKIRALVPEKDGQHCRFEIFGKQYALTIPIFGQFQIMNLLAAIGLCRALGASVDGVMAVLPELRAPTGRLQCVGVLKNNARVFVDYAHTPDALERVLSTMRVETGKGRLVCLFGCGGNRDAGKRAQMGAIADRLADVVYVTDDNPRFESADAIRKQIMEACPRGIEVPNRTLAIHRAVGDLRDSDVLVLAGKGHEPGQIIAGVSYVFDDITEAGLAIMERDASPLWSAGDLEMALSAAVPPWVAAAGVSIDTRALRPGDLFVALAGATADGHDFVAEAVRAGAAACVVARAVPAVPADKQIVVPDTQKALESLARFARMRSEALFVGVTGSSGKTTAKEMLRACLADQGATHATAGNLNNHIGVPLTLARLPLNAQYAVVEMGMNHAGELHVLTDLVRPDVVLITMIGAAHLGFFKTERDIAAAKAEIFDAQNRAGTAVLNRDDAFYDFLAQQARKRGIRKILSFGRSKAADFVLKSADVRPDGMAVRASLHGDAYAFDLNFVGDHFALNALGVLSAVDAVGASVERAVSSLKTIMPVAGRGGSELIRIGRKKITLIDDAYNANPSSMAASLRALALRPGRKVAVLGDMLELGESAERLHKELADIIAAAAIDKVYVLGDWMGKMFDALPAAQRGRTARTIDGMHRILTDDLRGGDVVLVKSSHGAGLHRLVLKLKGE